jgi:predicted transcriptional regulator
MKRGKSESNGDSIPENMEYLTSSRNRVKVLRSLVGASGTPEEVRDGLGVPRSTFQRILSELQERNWVEKRDGVYTVTPLGEYVEGYFSDSVEEMSTVDRLERFFEYVPFSEVGVGFDAIAESEVTLSQPSNPHAPTERTLGALEEADEVRALSPVITDIHSKRFYEAILNDETYVENVIPSSVAEAILSRYEGRFDDVRGTGKTETYVYDGELPLGLMVIDGTAFLGAYDDDGIARALVENDTDEMLEWARGYHEEYKESSETFDGYAGGTRPEPV